jgi:hypothetical protein
MGEDVLDIVEPYFLFFFALGAKPDASDKG